MRRPCLPLPGKAASIFKASPATGMIRLMPFRFLQRPETGDGVDLPPEQNVGEGGRTNLCRVSDRITHCKRGQTLVGTVTINLGGKSHGRTLQDHSGGVPHVRS
jgi:hypothetical protein